MGLNKTNPEPEYVPYGEEWEKEMMKMTKAELIDFIRSIIWKYKLERLREEGK